MYMYVYVYIYVCMYVCMYVYIFDNSLSALIGELQIYTFYGRNKINKTSRQGDYGVLSSRVI